MGRRNIEHGRCAVIIGLLVLAMAIVTSAGLAVHNAADASRRPVIALPRLTAPAAPPTTAGQRQSDEIGRAYLTAQFAAQKANSPQQGSSGDSLAVSPSATAVAFSPDGALLASAYSGGVIRLWDLATGQQHGQVLQAGSGGQAGMTAIAFSPDGGLLASAYRDGTIRLWDPATGRLVRSPLPGGSSVSAVAFSPDGKLLASAGTDGTIRLWNPATGQPVRSPLPAGSSVNAVAFSPDGKLLASADADGTVRVWNTAAFQAAGSGDTGWFIVLASVIALALSAFAVIATVREIRLARSILG
jgi:glucose/arabinose dehydrogenase